MPPAAVDRADVVVNGDDVPERGVDRIEFGRVALVHEAVGQHPFGHDPAHWSRIERASARRPVAMQSPRSAMKVSRPQSVNQGYPAMMVLPLPRLHHVGVGGALQRTSQPAPAGLLRPAQPLEGLDRSSPRHGAR